MASRFTRSRRPPALQPEQQPRARWTLFLTGILADLMVDQVHKVNKHGSSFSKQTWRSISSEFYNKTGLKWDTEQLKSRCAVLRRQYALVKSLLDQSEFSWDESTGAVIATDEAWNKYIMGHPDSETIRCNGCPIYKQLCTIFSEQVTNGKDDFSAEFGANGPSQMPNLEPLSTIHEELRSESEELDDAADDDDAFQPSTPGGTCSRKRGRKGIDDAIAAAILEMAAASRLRTAAVKQHNARFSVASCIKELDEMQGVEQRLYFAALDLFNNPNARETFLCLKVDKRLVWLQRKCASSGYLS